MESLLEGFGDALRLAAVAREAFSSGAATALSRFGLFFGVSCVGGHDVLLCFVRVYAGCRRPKRT